eukprot:COSAG06_NODE_38219_length_426_cov_0.403670_1_plen_71_part_00
MQEMQETGLSSVSSWHACVSRTGIVLRANGNLCAVGIPSDAADWASRAFGTLSVRPDTARYLHNPSPREF